MRPPRAAASVLAAVSMLGLAGCGSAVTAGTPTPAGTTAAPVSSVPSSTTAAPGPRNQADIQPCTDLTPADITAMGLDPATKDIDNISGQIKNHGCRWKSRDFIVGILATDGTVAIYNDPKKFAAVRLLTVAGLPAVATQLSDVTGVGGPDRQGCRLIADIPGGGGLAVQITTRSITPGPTDACDAAVRYMGLAAPILLKQ